MRALKTLGHPELQKGGQAGVLGVDPGQDTQSPSLRMGLRQSVLSCVTKSTLLFMVTEGASLGPGSHQVTGWRCLRTEGERETGQWTFRRFRPDLTAAGPPGPQGLTMMVTTSGKGVPEGYARSVRHPVSSCVPANGPLQPPSEEK